MRVWECERKSVEYWELAVQELRVEAHSFSKDYATKVLTDVKL